MLYEQRNVEPLLERLPELAPVAYIGLAGRPYEATFLATASQAREVARRVVRVDW